MEEETKETAKVLNKVIDDENANYAKLNSLKIDIENNRKLSVEKEKALRDAMSEYQASVNELSRF